MLKTATIENWENFTVSYLLNVLLICFATSNRKIFHRTKNIRYVASWRVIIVAIFINMTMYPRMRNRKTVRLSSKVNCRSWIIIFVTNVSGPILPLLVSPHSGCEYMDGYTLCSISYFPLTDKPAQKYISFEDPMWNIFPGRLEVNAHRITKIDPLSMSNIWMMCW